MEMDDINWDRVREIFDSALEQDADERVGFIEDACGGDDDLRQEVETLLLSAEKVDGFMDRPAVGHVADLIAAPDSLLHVGEMLGRYEILRKIGEGGMGEVYLAKDGDLNREVAIKLLHEKYAKSESDIRRFTREAKAASTLNHPNILTVHEIGRIADLHYIVSEFIQGQTLREILGNESPEISKVLEISVQVAAAVAAAHSARTIHRDVKPENIIVRNDGLVKVLDFGLAKLLPEPAQFGGLEVETIKKTLTTKGLILGTISYMSPEQARGEEIDERTDIFSLGILIYEMVAGCTPFEGQSMSDTFANLINKEPEPLSRFVWGVPVELERIIAKTLRKNRNDRYQTMQCLLADLRELKEQITLGRKLELTSPPGSERVTQAIRAVTNGVAEETEKKDTSRSIGSIMSGRWAYIGAITLLALIGTGIYTVHWSPFATVQPEKTAATVGSKYSRSPAYDHYMRGRVNAGSENRENNEKAIGELEQAVALDPELAPAYAELAHAYNVKAFYLASSGDFDKFYENAVVAVEKSLAIDPDLPEGHFARGLVLWSPKNRFPHEQTILSYKRALDLNPDLDEAHHQLGLVYFHIGLFDKASEEIQKAVAINPGNTLARYRLGVVDLYRGKYEEALLIFESTPLEKNPSLWAFQTATAQFNLGRIKEAEALIDKFLRDYPKDEGGVGNSVKAMVLAKDGREREAENAIQRAVELGNGFGPFHHTSFNIAAAYGLMNKPEKAVQWLKKAAEDGLPCYPLFESDPSFSSIRTNDQFVALVAKLKQQWERYQAAL